MPKRKYSQQVINSAKLAGRTPAQQYAISERKRVDAFMAARAPRRPVRKTVPLTPEEIRSAKAAGRRKKVEPGFLTRLRKALGGE